MQNGVKTLLLAIQKVTENIKAIVRMMPLILREQVTYTCVN